MPQGQQQGPAGPPGGAAHAEYSTWQNPASREWNADRRDGKEKDELGKAPTFDGTGNVEGFLRLFRKWKRAKGISEETAAIRLVGALRDEAKEHVENMEHSEEATFDEIEEELLRTYGGAA